MLDLDDFADFADFADLGRRRAAWSPALLFGASDTGWVYDNDDLSTLFQNAAGTTPVTAAGQPVGLQLDKSQGAGYSGGSFTGLGPELVTNGDFSDGATGWTLGPGWSVASGKAIFAGGADSTLSYPVNIAEAGKRYLVLMTVSDYVNGSAAFRLGNVTVNDFTTSANGAHTFTALAEIDGGIAVRAVSSAGGFAIDNISVRELPGNHRFQSTALNRPTLRQDANGRYYLEYDGVNDSLAAASLAWGSDKVTICTGVRKLSDAARGTLIERTASIDSNDGAFHLTAPNAASDSFAFESKGTALADAVATGVAAPATRVLTGIADIAGDSATLRVNGTEAATDTADQGTGDYAAAVTYFGARGGSSQFFNGWEYSSVGINRLLTADELTQLEGYVNSKTGAY